MNGLIQKNKDGLSQIKHCNYKVQCSSYYSTCNSMTCQLLEDLLINKIPPFIPKKEDKRNIIYFCPRNPKIGINAKCINTSCVYFNPKMTANCLSIHSEIFNKDIMELLSISFNTDKTYFERGMKLVSYSYRLYIILIAYILYTDSKQNLSIIPNEEEIKQYLDGLIDDKNWLLQPQNEEQLSFNTSWVYELNSGKILEDLNSIGYKKYYHEYHKYKNKLAVMKQVIYNTSIHNKNLIKVPLLFIVRCYYKLFGIIDITNFAMSDRKGKKLIELFLDGDLK